MKEKFRINGEFVAASVASGLILVPFFGWLPLCAILAGVATSYAVSNEIDRRL